MMTINPRYGRKKFFIYPILLFCCALFYACANQLQPNGGLKDEIPPELVRSKPEQGTLSYVGNQVTFIFSEPVNTVSYGKEVFISPLPVRRPTIRISDNAKKINIRFNEALRPNTTYVVTLNEVTDRTERNKLKGSINFAFSTGEQLDSAQIKGRVFMPTVGQAEEDMLMLLFDADSIEDNNIFRKRPAYITKTDATGNFAFDFLRKTPYKVYGIKDEDQSNTYSQFNERLAIGEDPLVAFPDTSKLVEVLLYSFLPDERAPQYRTFEWKNDSILLARFDERFIPENFTLTATDTLGRDSVVLTDYQLISSAEQELYIKMPRPRDSTTRLNFLGLVDSLGNSADTLTVVGPANRKRLEDPFVIRPTFNFQTELMEAYLGTWLAADDSNSVYLTDTTKARLTPLDSTVSVSIPSDSIIPDSLLYPNRIECDFQISPFKLVIDPGKNVEAQEPYVLHLKGKLMGRADTIFRYVLRWPDPTNFGILKGTVKVEGYEGPVIVQLMKDKTVTHTSYQRNFEFQYVEPGMRFVRVIMDEDSTKNWTPGNLYPLRLPEKILIDSRQEDVRANWEIEDFEVILNPARMMEAAMSPPAPDTTAQKKPERGAVKPRTRKK